MTFGEWVKITGFEFKWNPKVKVSIPSNFVNAYQASIEIVSRENFREFVGVFGDK